MSRPRECNEPDCSVQIIFARIPGRPGHWLPLEADDREPFADASTGAVVVISGQAWTPHDAIEDFQTRFEITESKAREVISGYPWHRPHLHPNGDAA